MVIFLNYLPHIQFLIIHTYAHTRTLKQKYTNFHTRPSGIRITKEIAIDLLWQLPLV